MKGIRILLLAVLAGAAACAGGCSGDFILTAPDVAVVAGKSAPVVIRLQRREVGNYTPAVNDAAITFKLDQQPLRSAHTDRQGYAALVEQAPDKPGRYAIALHHQNSKGDVVESEMSMFVLAGDRPIVAVDLDSLPRGAASTSAAQALTQMAGSAQFVYVTTDLSEKPRIAHEVLSRGGYPDGPVVGYRKEMRWQMRAAWLADPLRPLAVLRERLPNLASALTADPDAAGTFVKLGLKTIIIEERPKSWYSWPAGGKLGGAQYVKTWATLRLAEPTPEPATAPAR